MKKLTITVTHELYVKDELDIEQVLKMDHILFNGRHYCPDMFWMKVQTEEEDKASPLSKIEGMEFEYGDSAIGVDMDEFEDEIRADEDDLSDDQFDMHDWSISIESVKE